jgi:hypothetical protein
VAHANLSSVEAERLDNGIAIVFHARIIAQGQALGNGAGAGVKNDRRCHGGCFVKQ